MLRDKWNWSLAALLFCIMIGCIATIIFNAEYYKDKITLAALAVAQTFEILGHWCITDTYLKTANATGTILSKKTKDVDQQHLAKIAHGKFTFRLAIARWVVILLSLASGLAF